MPDRTYYVYILSNTSRTLYIGVTNSLERRMYQHRMKARRNFTRRYNITVLVHVESFERAGDAIACEKQLKGWSRAKKVALVETLNPAWADLSAEWFVGVTPSEANGA